MYVSVSPRPASTSSTRRRRRWSGVRAPNISRRVGSVNGTSSSRLRATSSTTSTSRVTSRARQVGVITSTPLCSKPSRSSQSICSAGGVAMPISSSARSGRKWMTGHSGRRSCTSVCPTQRAPAVSTSSWVASLAAGSARYGSTPFSQRFEPSVRRRRRSEVRKMVVGSKLAASSSTSVVDSPISVSSPPMIPASATERSASAIIRSVGSSLRSTPSRVRIVSPGTGAADDDLPALQGGQVEGVQRVAEREHDVVGHVHDVGDRAHSRR